MRRDARAKTGKSLGPLDGRIVSIKDLYDVAGEVTRAGSKVLADEGMIATADAPVVKRLRAAGAVIVAKTNMSEFAFSGVGANPHFGTPGNPCDRARAPGGSTSGGAVAVADAMCEITIGSDTGGSTRIPAALCGIVGWKPSKQRVPTEGAFPLSFTLDSIGPMAKTVTECALADAGDGGRNSCRRLSAVPLSGLRDLASIWRSTKAAMPFEGMDETVSAAMVRTRSPGLDRRMASTSSDEKISYWWPTVIAGQRQRRLRADQRAYSIHFRERLKDRGDGIDPFYSGACIERGGTAPALDYHRHLAQTRRRLVQQSDGDAAHGGLDALVATDDPNRRTRKPRPRLPRRPTDSAARTHCSCATQTRSISSIFVLSRCPLHPSRGRSSSTRS